MINAINTDLRNSERKSDTSSIYLCFIFLFFQYPNLQSQFTVEMIDLDFVFAFLRQFTVSLNSHRDKGKILLIFSSYNGKV
jgi:hypothetical protein